MIKYVPEMTSVVMEEIPDKVTLAVDISNCTGLCEGCHSPFLRKDVGEELTPESVDSMLSANFGVNCFLFLGEGNDPEALMKITAYIRKVYPALTLAIYSGRESVEDEIFASFDYVKVGPFLPSCGPLNHRTTNQRLYKVSHKKSAAGSAAADEKSYELEDITYRFWRSSSLSL